MKYRQCGQPRSRNVLVLLAVIILAIYSNSFFSPWHLDDVMNIVVNPKVAVQDLYPATLGKAMHADYNGGLYSADHLFRPVVMLSFALNWYASQGAVFWFHLVNILIHYLTAAFLFLTVCQLFKTPALKSIPHGTAYHTALLGVLFWAIHPIQIQAVTYIVQRMASMAALFYSAGLFFFLKGRLSEGWRRYGLFFICALCFCLALGCKENVITFPVALAGFEILFFSSGRPLSGRAKPKWWLFAVLALISVLLVTAAILNGNFSGLLAGYEARPFTMNERVFTQFRVIWFYMYQIFFPAVSQFSIDHGFTISKSLWDPWTTAASLVGLVILLTIGLVTIRKGPLISLAILFFFLNHIVESSFLPLEMVFEHRNYLPSFFLFVAPAFLVARYWEEYRRKKDLMRCAIAGIVVTSLILIVGMATYIRNFDWQTEKQLWESAMEHAPQNARPYQNLAIHHYRKQGQFDIMTALLKKAIPLESSRPDSSLSVSYSSLCKIYTQEKDWEKAIAYGKQAVEARPTMIALESYIQALLGAGELEQALAVYEDNFKTFQNVSSQSTLALILLRLGREEPAYKAALSAVKLDPFDPTACAVMGYASMCLKKYEKADHYFQLAVNNFKKNEKISLYLGMIENASRAGFSGKQDHYLETLLASFPAPEIKKTIKAELEMGNPVFRFQESKTLVEVSKALVGYGTGIRQLPEKADE